MADEKKTLMTPEFRVSFAHVFKPQPAMDEGKDPKFGITMLFAPDADLSKLKAAASAAAKAKWGDNIPANMRSPFRDQGEKNLEGYVPGAIFINATSKQRPGLVDAGVNDIIDETEFYSGCYARATVNAFAYEARNPAGAVVNRGVAFGLNNVQKLRDGEPFSGRTKASEDFEAVDGGGEGEVAEVTSASDLF